MLSAAAARAFLWDSLPDGFQVFNIVALFLFVVYVSLVFAAWNRRRSESAVASAAEKVAAADTEMDAADKAVAAAATGDEVGRVTALATKAVAAANKAAAAADRAVAAASEFAAAVDSVKTPDERAMAASSVGTFVTLGVAAAAVLLTGAGVLLGVEGGGTALPRSVFTELVVATGWLVASLIFGVISASSVITRIHLRRSVAETRSVIVFAAGQLIALLVGALCFMLSITLF